VFGDVKPFMSLVKEYKKIIRHSMVYGLGLALSQMVGFVMIPVYTRYLTPADYGVYELLILTTKILTMFLTLGLSSATLRYYFEYENEETKDKVISTALIAALLISFAGATSVNLFRNGLSWLCFDSYQYVHYFTLVLFAMAFEIAMEIPLAYIRAKELSHIFVFLIVSRLIVALSLNILFVVYYELGLKGILLSNLITATIFGTGIIAYTFVKTTIGFSKKLFTQLFLYGWPLILSGFGFFVINSTDRFFLKHFLNLEEVGLYSLSVRFASVLSIVLLGPFWKMYGPYRFSIMKKDEAREIYANVQKIMLFVMLVCALGMIVLSKDVLIILTPISFHGAYSAIPFLVLSTVSLTCYYLFQTGIYLQKQTKVISKLVSVAAVSSLTFNYLLIPHMGMVGAALAKFLTLFFLAVMTYVVSQKKYKIHYDHKSNFIIVILALITWFLSTLVLFDNIWLRMFMKCGVLIVYVMVMCRFLFGTLDKIRLMFSPGH